MWNDVLLVLIFIINSLVGIEARVVGLLHHWLFLGSHVALRMLMPQLLLSLMSPWIVILLLLGRLRLHVELVSSRVYFQVRELVLNGVHIFDFIYLFILSCIKFGL